MIAGRNYSLKNINKIVSHILRQGNSKYGSFLLRPKSAKFDFGVPPKISFKLLESKNVRWEQLQAPKIDLKPNEHHL